MGSLNPENPSQLELDDSGYVQEDASSKETQSEDKSPNLLDLSDDVLLYILQYLSPIDLKSLGFTCLRLGTLVLDRTLWQRVDARGVPTGRRRMQWLLTHALSAHTTTLKLSGYAKETIICDGGFSCWPVTPNCVGLLSAQEAKQGPPQKPRPLATLSSPAMIRLSEVCPNLTELVLENVVIDCKATKITMFPKSLRILSMRGSKCFNVEKPFLYKIHDYLINLEDLDVSQCEWVEPASMLPLSKLPRLTRLVMQECVKLQEFVAYASLATRYGFKTLKILDLRGSPVGDSEVSAWGWAPRLEELYLSPAAAPRAHPDLPPVRVELTPWEDQEPEYYSSKYESEQWIAEESAPAPPGRSPDECIVGTCMILHHMYVDTCMSQQMHCPCDPLGPENSSTDQPGTGNLPNDQSGPANRPSCNPNVDPADPVNSDGAGVGRNESTRAKEPGGKQFEVENGHIEDENGQIEVECGRNGNETGRIGNESDQIGAESSQIKNESNNNSNVERDNNSNVGENGLNKGECSRNGSESVLNGADNVKIEAGIGRSVSENGQINNENDQIGVHFGGNGNFRPYTPGSSQNGEESDKKDAGNSNMMLDGGRYNGEGTSEQNQGLANNVAHNVNIDQGGPEAQVIINVTLNRPRNEVNAPNNYDRVQASGSNNAPRNDPQHPIVEVCRSRHVGQTLDIGAVDPQDINYDSIMSLIEAKLYGPVKGLHPNCQRCASQKAQAAANVSHIASHFPSEEETARPSSWKIITCPSLDGASFKGKASSSKGKASMTSSTKAKASSSKLKSSSSNAETSPDVKATSSEAEDSSKSETSTVADACSSEAKDFSAKSEASTSYESSLNADVSSSQEVISSQEYASSEAEASNLKAPSKTEEVSSSGAEVSLSRAKGSSQEKEICSREPSSKAYDSTSKSEAEDSLSRTEEVPSFNDEVCPDDLISSAPSSKPEVPSNAASCKESSSPKPTTSSIAADTSSSKSEASCPISSSEDESSSNENESENALEEPRIFIQLQKSFRPQEHYKIFKSRNSPKESLSDFKKRLLSKYNKSLDENGGQHKNNEQDDADDGPHAKKSKMNENDKEENSNNQDPQATENDKENIEKCKENDEENIENRIENDDEGDGGVDENYEDEDEEPPNKKQRLDDNNKRKYEVSPETNTERQRINDMYHYIKNSVEEYNKKTESDRENLNNSDPNQPSTSGESSSAAGASQPQVNPPQPQANPPQPPPNTPQLNRFVRFSRNQPAVVVEGAPAAQVVRDNNHNVPFDNYGQPLWNAGPNRPAALVIPSPDVREAEPRNRILYVNVGRRRHAMYRVAMPEPDRPSQPVLLFPPHTPRLDFVNLVTDTAIRRYGRPIGENINYVQIGPRGIVPAPFDDPHARPDRSSLRVLSVTGFRHITDASLNHLATAAPYLQFVDFSGTSVSDAGVMWFRGIRPDCKVRYGPMDMPKEEFGPQNDV